MLDYASIWQCEQGVALFPGLHAQLLLLAVLQATKAGRGEKLQVTKAGHGGLGTRLNRVALCPKDDVAPNSFFFHLLFLEQVGGSGMRDDAFDSLPSWIFLLSQWAGAGLTL